jgi:hypothetical protein
MNLVKQSQPGARIPAQNEYTKKQSPEQENMGSS